MEKQHVMTNDIVENHSERMKNIKKYYPWFKLAEITFSQYQEGKYEGRLDMGYITLAVLRFFIEENNFKEKGVAYEEYETFLKDLLHRDFQLHEERQQEKELILYIFDKLRNDGKPFSFTYFDPADKKWKTARLKLIESELLNDQIFYYITADGAEFYLDTKEIKEESSINIEQLLLEKLIKTQNFKGGTEVVKRINNEVSRLKAKKNEVLGILSCNVFEGMKAYEQFVETGMKWFREEQKLFQKNMELIHKALARAEAGSFYKSMEELYILETELKKAISKHSELLSACTDLQKKTDEIVGRAKVSALRTSFDFQAMLKRAMEDDCADDMELLVKPLLKLNMKKTFSLHSLDDMLSYRQDRQETGEKIKEEQEENYQYEDELEDLRIEENYGELMHCFLEKLVERKEMTLEEFNEVLMKKFGEEIFRNGDYYSFFIHLNQKKEYNISKIIQNPDTFLEEIISKFFKNHPDQISKHTTFQLTAYGEQKPQLELLGLFQTSNVKFQLMTEEE